MSIYLEKMGDTQTQLNLLLLHQIYKPNNIPGINHPNSNNKNKIINLIFVKYVI